MNTFCIEQNKDTMPDAYENFNMAMLNNIITNDDQYLTYNDISHQTSMYNINSLSSPYSSSQDNTSASPMSISSSPQHMTDLINLNNVAYGFEAIGEPYIEILVQPVEKFRFRYKSEMIGTHGALLGVPNGHSRKKGGPMVKLHNYLDKAIIRCLLVTSDDTQNRIPHAHKLMRRHGLEDNIEEPHDIEVSADNNFIATFNGLGIVHTARKYIKDELIRKLREDHLEKRRRDNINATINIREDAEIKANAEQYQKSMNVNSVSLSFQAFLKDEHNIMTPITAPVYSTPINNLKSALTGELKICRIDKHTSSCEGGEEVFIFVEKVGKKNIKIKFFEVNEDDCEIWCDYGRFSELDVHHQYAIVFRTPAYRDLNITSPVEVFIQLERPSDSDCSEPIKFIYKPSDRIIGRKRTRISHSNSAELARLTYSYTTSTADITPTTANESAEISKEIKKMLDDGCSSGEFRNFVETGLDLDLYANLLENSEENKLTCDGPLKKEEDDKAFARNVVNNILKSLKTQTNIDQEISKNERENTIRSLLKDKSTYGDSPLHVALRYGQKDTAKYIFMLMTLIPDHKTFVNMQNSSGKTPLHYAVTLNQPENIKVLLLLGADPNLSDHSGQMPLHCAVKIQEARECVGILLSRKNTDFEAYTELGWTPLHLAAEAGSYYAVQYLVTAGVDVNKTDMSCGRTALHIAVEGGHVNIVEFLLKHCATDVNKRNFSGNTALHSAVVTPGVKAQRICALLMEHGANPHIKNHTRESNNDEAPGISTIKTEVDSEDENADEGGGQSSFDLASDNPEMLNLVSGKGDAVASIIKTEEDLDESQRIWLDTEQEKQLSEILNRTEGWKKLVNYYNLTYLLKSKNNLSNPALFILNFILIEHDISLQQFQNILHSLGEEDAVTYLNQILSYSS